MIWISPMNMKHRSFAVYHCTVYTYQFPGKNRIISFFTNLLLNRRQKSSKILNSSSLPLFETHFLSFQVVLSRLECKPYNRVKSALELLLGALQGLQQAELSPEDKRNLHFWVKKNLYTKFPFFFKIFFNILCYFDKKAIKKTTNAFFKD